jgi:hypothetical protein
VNVSTAPLKIGLWWEQPGIEPATEIALNCRNIESCAPSKPLHASDAGTADTGDPGTSLRAARGEALQSEVVGAQAFLLSALPEQPMLERVAEEELEERKGLRVIS